MAHYLKNGTATLFFSWKTALLTLVLFFIESATIVWAVHGLYDGEVIATHCFPLLIIMTFNSFLTIYWGLPLICSADNDFRSGMTFAAVFLHFFAIQGVAIGANSCQDRGDISDIWLSVVCFVIAWIPILIFTIKAIVNHEVAEESYLMFKP